MSQSDFQERLNRMETPATAESGASSPVMKSRAEKIALALEVLRKNGVGANAAYPPAYRALARIGLAPRPAPYQSALVHGLIGVALSLVIFGGIYVSGLSASFQSGPVAGLHSAGWTGIAVMSVLGAIVMPVFNWLAVQGKDLPRWEDL